MKLIVGLGNKGNEYNNTRHNVGFMVVDNYINKNNLTLKSKLDGLYAETIINGEKVIFLKPQNYINLSGDVINKYIKYFKIDIKDILVIHDDMDLEIGTFKIRYKGGSAGHNGLKNIESNLKTNEYKRIKIGISKNNIDKVDYVLGKFSSTELSKLNKVIDITYNIIEDFVSLSFENLMNKYNGYN
ncbi:MAG TPA: aminoacyl-tRNA hydrolase [Candidatus Faecisoma merdavium]|nr:aminoacyl-tRNA hydrolase [Candidatus Faecisoma merdavium]